jgi:hypothetical protein
MATKTINKKSSLIGAIKCKSVISDSANFTFTQNGALTKATTKSSVLDFFALGGALRNRAENEVTNLFEQAFLENELLALKAIFYIRDPRGGQGERKTFRSVLKWLVAHYPAVVKKNLALIAEYGRWDDLLVLLGTSLEKDMVKLIKAQLKKDLASLDGDRNISLAGKWLPGENTSSQETVEQARALRTALGMSQKAYRKMLSALRAKINIVERLMCSQEFSAINYEQVPSRAAMIYRKAFEKQDPIRYAVYKASVEKGEAKINTSTLYPYDLLRNVRSGNWDQTIELQWKNLPDYLDGDKGNGLVVCDVSGSMTRSLYGNVPPIDVSVSLAIYIAERNKGLFKDHFITFSTTPELQHIVTGTLQDKYFALSRSAWTMSTNLEAVFDLVLSKAILGKVPKNEMPSTLYIISDMEFDAASRGTTNFEAIKSKYATSGYKMPRLVFWNVDAKSDQVPITTNDKGVVLVSGCNPSILKSLLANKNVGAYDLMLEVLNAPRYDKIKV